MLAFAPGMSQLHPGARTLSMKKFNDPLQAGDVIVFPQPEILRGDAAFGKHCCRFRKHQSRSAHRPAA